MFIKYSDTNVHALPHLVYIPKRMKNKKTGKITVRQVLDSSQAPQDIHSLKPGWNEFPKHIWEQSKDHPQIQHMLKKRKIELMEEKVTIVKGGKKLTKVVGQDDEPVRLRWFDSKRARQIALETYNRDLLQRWLDEETRSPVKRALEKQLKPLMTQATSDGDSSDDDETSAED